MTKTKTMSALGGKNLALIVALLFVGVFFVGGDDHRSVALAQYDCDGMDCTSEEWDLYYNSNNYNISYDEGEYNTQALTCPAGYIFDAQGTNCVPADGCAEGESLKNGVCVDDQGVASNCDYGYIWDGDSCVAADSCPDGSAYVNGRCVDTSGAVVGSSCDPSPSCWFYNCCSSESTNDTPEPATAEQINANNSNKLAANSASANAQNYVRQANTANAQLASCGGDAAKCAAAQAAVNKANADLLAANAAAEAAVAQYNASNAIVNPQTATTGAGFMLCANGVLATVCEGGGGTPYVAGISSGGNYGGGSFGGGTFGGGSGTVNSPKCEVGFTDIGGVCFPGNTGLSDAPIYVILSNIFSWLMGLFTTLAVVAFVVSGIQYFMASGDESMAESAKDNAKNALIGIVVGLSGFIIIKAIAMALSGTSYFF